MQNTHPPLPEQIAAPPEEVTQRLPEAQTAVLRVEEAETEQPLYPLYTPLAQLPILPKIELFDEARRTSGCGIELNAATKPGAMVALDLDAPCQQSQNFTLHHEGMMLSFATNARGEFSVDVPALRPRAVYLVSFANGSHATAETDVPGVTDVDRVVLQWLDDFSPELHAFEFSADYGENGHVWPEKTNSMATLISAEGGNLLKYMPAQIGGRHAQVYTFPTGTIQRTGQISLSIETEVTAKNCSQNFAVETLRTQDFGLVEIEELTLAMPGCDAIGEYLVLNNLLQNIEIAQE